MDYITALIIIVPSIASIGWITWHVVGTARAFCKLKRDQLNQTKSVK